MGLKRGAWLERLEIGRWKGGWAGMWMGGAGMWTGGAGMCRMAKDGAGIKGRCG